MSLKRGFRPPRKGIARPAGPRKRGRRQYAGRHGGSAPRSIRSPTPTRASSLKEKTMGLTIVVGYDGSQCAKAALDQALGLAGPDGRVVITYADAPPRIGASSLVPPENIVALGRKVTEEALQVARERGVPAEVVLEDERPAEALLKVAARTRADIIAVGLARRVATDGPAARLHPLPPRASRDDAPARRAPGGLAASRPAASARRTAGVRPPSVRRTAARLAASLPCRRKM